MLHKYCIVVTLICVCLSFGQKNQLNLEESQELNETIEFGNNCTCVPYQSCSYANNYSVMYRLNYIPKSNCSDPDQLCCEIRTNPDTTSTESSTDSDLDPTTDVPTTTTTIEPSNRNPDTFNNCGEPKTNVGVRILNSEVESAAAIPGEFPWIVEIFEKPRYPTNPHKYKCHGTLIHPKVVLTATHCVVSNVKKPQTLKIVATGRDIFQKFGLNSKDERNAVKIIKHQDYNSGNLHNDIALIILDKVYSYSNSMLNSVCLPKLNQSFDGRRCILAGWGKNQDLKNIPLLKVDLPVVNSQKCQDILKEALSNPAFTLHDSFICAGGEEGKDSCEGDGGAPLMCLGEEYEFLQVGIVSWGPNDQCGVVGKPGIYVNVSKFSEWIRSTLLNEGITI